MRNAILSILVLLLPWACENPAAENEIKEENTLPNIVIFYVDDLGYGDLGSYGATSVKTPNVDAFANGGLLFTDAHSTAATCTPSRYSILTGEYAFRNKAAILPGDAPLLIDTSKFTLPKMLKKAGYQTAVVGKWHLGLGLGDINWNKKVAPGPLEIGFDYSFLLPATGDRVPTVYLENHHVINLNKEDPLRVSYNEDLGQTRATPQNARYVSDSQHSETLVNGVGRIGAMVGGKSAYWLDEEFPDIFTGKANQFIEDNQNKPFFLFFSFHDIHVPRLPNERFLGKTDMGPRGDAIAQMDWMTGQIVNKLKELGLEENTLIIFTSDNGPILDDGYADEAVERLGEHQPSGPFRGAKYSALEAGTRVPTIAYWPGTIEKGESNALISQVDLFASLAQMADISLAEGEAIDSEALWSTWLGESGNGREFMIEESYTLALRKGPWKYIQPVPQTSKIPLWMKNKKIETGLSYEAQLYNLDSTLDESVNVAKEYPELLMELKQKLESIVESSIQ